ncbi:MAG TPA: haloacid dehalogenase type II [Candidatus Limnocylindrales bacterium]
MTADRRVDAVFFDLFGTLLSLARLGDACDRLAPGRGQEIATRWRARQLEATWLRTAMERWADFDAVTRDALAGTLDELGVEHPSDIDDVARTFLDLPLEPGATDAIRALQRHGVATGVLTNATRRTLDHVSARLALELDPLLSVDDARRFKPHPSVYQLAVEATGLAPDRIGFVTANGWDAAGAGTFGFHVAWLRADPRAVLPAVGSPKPTVATWTDVPRLFGTLQP